jgi:cell division protein FtsL
MKIPTFTLALISALVAVMLFTVKYRVQALNDELEHLDLQIVADREALHILKAEWSHLNHPKRLRDMADRHLNLGQIDAERISSIEEINKKLPNQNQEYLQKQNHIIQLGTGE